MWFVVSVVTQDDLICGIPMNVIQAKSFGQAEHILNDYCQRVGMGTLEIVFSNPLRREYLVGTTYLSLMQVDLIEEPKQ